MTWSGLNGQSEAPPAFYTFSSPRMQSSLRDFYLNRTAELVKLVGAADRWMLGEDSGIEVDATAPSDAFVPTTDATLPLDAAAADAGATGDAA